MKKNEEKKQELSIRFKLPESVKFPETIFDGCKSMDDVRKALTENLVAIQEKDVIANRLMSSEEITEIRSKYGDIMETNIPKLEAELDILKAEFNAEKKEFEAKISAARTEFMDLVHLAKKGIKDFELNMQDTFRIPICGHYCYYTWLEGSFVLALVQRIPDHEMNDLFNSGKQNETKFKELGYDLPEVLIEDKRVNVRRFKDTEYGDIEVWEEKGKDVWVHQWTEDFVDESIGEVVSIERHENFCVPFDESPFRDGTYTEDNGETSEEERPTDEVSGESEK